jgi:hypothetical protein
VTSKVIHSDFILLADHFGDLSLALGKRHKRRRQMKHGLVFI